MGCLGKLKTPVMKGVSKLQDFSGHNTMTWVQHHRYLNVSSCLG
mgnify:FL=1